MSEGKLQQAIKKYEKGIDLSCQFGKKTSLSAEVEKTLASVIVVQRKIGFSPSKDEALDLFQSTKKKIILKLRSLRMDV